MPLDFLLAAISILIILGLAFYAGILISRIRAQTELNKQRKEQQQAKQQARNDRICDSIRVIARATIHKQCNLSEAAIRLTILLETLVLKEAIDIGREYPALMELFDKVKEMPTHDQRKKVPVKELKKLDKQRLIFENKLEKKIIKEAAQLADFSV